MHCLHRARTWHLKLFSIDRISRQGKGVITAAGLPTPGSAATGLPSPDSVAAGVSTSRFGSGSGGVGVKC